ncbi:MAG: hypothetical protein HQK54_15905 [Oligoflexales bacterium]|nr:hypothetical protein [Oligoflexales bacterium]
MGQATVTAVSGDTIALDKTLNASVGDRMANMNLIGSGYIVRNNIVRNRRARGMLLKANDGLVENNTVEGSTMPGISETPEYWWNESDYSHNVIIRNKNGTMIRPWRKAQPGYMLKLDYCHKKPNNLQCSIFCYSTRFR